MRKINANEVHASSKGPKEKWPLLQWLEEIKQLKDNEWLLIEAADMPSRTKYPGSYIRHMMRTKYKTLVETKVVPEGILLRLERPRQPNYVTATSPQQPETATSPQQPETEEIVLEEPTAENS